MKLLRQLAVTALLPLAAAAQSFDFKSVGDVPAVMVDAPTQKGIKRFIAPPGMPVEVVHVSGDWSKVRDAAGDMTWVESKYLVNRRTVIVKAERAVVLKKPEDGAPLSFEAERNVSLDFIEAVHGGCIKVRHLDGQEGFVRAGQIWGV